MNRLRLAMLPPRWTSRRETAHGPAPGPIRVVGEHHVKLHLHSDVILDLPVDVVGEE